MTIWWIWAGILATDLFKTALIELLKILFILSVTQITVKEFLWLFISENYWKLIDHRLLFLLFCLISHRILYCNDGITLWVQNCDHLLPFQSWFTISSLTLNFSMHQYVNKKGTAKSPAYWGHQISDVFSVLSNHHNLHQHWNWHWIHYNCSNTNCKSGRQKY